MRSGVGSLPAREGDGRVMYMVRRFRVVSLIALVLLGLVAGTAGSVAADQNYACADNSCAFAVPDSYSVASNDPSQIIFTDAISGGVFSVVSQDASGLNSLDDAVNSIATNAAASDGYQAGPSNGKSTVLAGNPATLIEYLSNNSNGTLVETAVFVTLYQGKQYQLIFVTTPDSEDAFVSGAQNIFGSWQFT
jgi:hypothetical protein